MSLASDYQIFDFHDGKITNVRGRMADKLGWMPTVAKGARVLDVGTDFGFWCWWAREQGASSVLGIDRGRDVKGAGFVDTAAHNADFASRHGLGDVCRFERVEIGRQWPDLWRFDHIIVCSVYHHIYEAAGGDHLPVWYWLRRQCATGATLIWEGPVDTSDPVVRANVSPKHQPGYTFDAIRDAALRYFDMELIGPAVHEATRWAYRLTAKRLRANLVRAEVRAGAGGATKAFLHADGRRSRELEYALGIECFPGSLNLQCEQPFDWDAGYYPVLLSDVLDRGKGFDSEWGFRPARLCPVTFDGQDAFALRFNNDPYPLDFVEIIADIKLRSEVRPKAMLAREL